MIPNGSFMNPNMMFNGSWMNQGQNITGSINLAPTMINSITSQINVSLSDAASIAQKQVGNNSHVVAAHLDIVNGYLTYTVIATDPDANIHKFVIDAGNGKVLSSSKLSWQNMMMFEGMMNHNKMGPMMNHNKMGPMMNPNMMGPMMGFR
jgi:peptidase YpeB-like protein